MRPEAGANLTPFFYFGITKAGFPFMDLLLFLTFHFRHFLFHSFETAINLLKTKIRVFFDLPVLNEVEDDEGAQDVETTGDGV